MVMNARFSGGTRNTGVQSAADCLELCMMTTDCHAVDYSSDADECWVHTDVADLTQTNTAPGYRQYLQLSQCDQGGHQLRHYHRHINVRVSVNRTF